MADQTAQSMHLATLFETITGQSKFTEQQQINISVRYDEHGEETDIAHYLETTALEFEDAIQETETY